MRPNWWSSKSVFLAITILFFFVSAAHAATVAVGNKITLSSKTVSVPVKLKTAAGESISALNCEISYDTAVLANPKVSTGIAAKIADKEALTGSSSPGKLSFSLFGMNNKKIPNGIIARIEFDVVATSAVTPITISAKGATPAAVALQIEGKDGKIVIK